MTRQRQLQVGCRLAHAAYAVTVEQHQLKLRENTGCDCVPTPWYLQVSLEKQNLTKLYNWGVLVCFLFYKKPYDPNQLKAERSFTLHFRKHSITKESCSRDSSRSYGRMLLYHDLLSLLSYIHQDHPSGSGLSRPIYINY